MKEKKVVRYKDLPSRLPIGPTLMAYLLLEHFDAGGLAWGIVSTLFVLLWGLIFYSIANEKSTSVFDD